MFVPSIRAAPEKTHKFIMKKSHLLAFCSLVLSLAGCATPQSMDYQSGISANTERVGRVKEAEIAIDPFVDSARSRKFFGVDAMGEGIAILHVRIVNKTTDETLLVRKDHFHLVRGGAQVFTQDLEKPDHTTGVEKVLDGLSIGGGAGLAAATRISHATQIQMNFTSKEMGDQTLSPGQSVEGFIYFGPVKQGEDWTRDTVVQADLLPTQNGSPVEMKISLAN
jgi:hypothetical protein